MKKIRSFIAIGLPASVRGELKRLSEELAALLEASTVRWVRPEAVHLTLRFLGDTPMDKLPSIAEALDSAAARSDRFTLWLSGLGSFPNRRRPRVIWVGLDGDLGRLQVTHQDLSTSLETLGWERERRAFHPHLTLGRVKDSRAFVRANIDWDREVKPVAFQANEITLFESKLRPTGAIYSVRHTSRFRG